MRAICKWMHKDMKNQINLQKSLEYEHIRMKWISLTINFFQWDCVRIVWYAIATSQLLKCFQTFHTATHQLLHIVKSKFGINLKQIHFNRIDLVSMSYKNIAMGRETHYCEYCKESFLKFKRQITTKHKRHTRKQDTERKNESKSRLKSTENVRW